MSVVRVGVLTGGGDCPGLNAVIRAIVRKGETVYGDEIIGFLDAWDGVLEQRTMPPRRPLAAGDAAPGRHPARHQAGKPVRLPRRPGAGAADLRPSSASTALIVIGGNGSLTVACRLHDQLDLPIVGVPKTIDNDIVGTDVTFGFHTAVQIATDAIDRLHTTAESHDRVMLVEVMGRHAGLDRHLRRHRRRGHRHPRARAALRHRRGLRRILRRRHRRGRYASIVVVAEGAEPAEGTMDLLAQRPSTSSGTAKLGGHRPPASRRRSRSAPASTPGSSQLGHVQRGGTPNAYDRVLSTRYGLAAIDAVHDKAWGEMVVYRESRIERAPLRLALGRTRTLDLSMYEDVAAIFFG